MNGGSSGGGILRKHSVFLSSTMLGSTGSSLDTKSAGALILLCPTTATMNDKLVIHKQPGLGCPIIVTQTGGDIPLYYWLSGIRSHEIYLFSMCCPLYTALFLPSENQCPQRFSPHRYE